MMLLTSYSVWILLSQRQLTLHYGKKEKKYAKKERGEIDKDDNSWKSSDTSQGGFWEGGKHWSEVIREC